VEEITASGARSIAAKRIENSWVNTGIYVNFAQAPEPLSRFIRTRQFSSLVEERTRNFVGREYIFEAINERINGTGFPSGYVVIKGEPGIGKTALIAKLIQQRGYTHHFNISQQQINSADAFLKNICAQLIVRYQLSHSALPFTDALTDSGFLSELLSEAAEKSEEAVVVLIDALDEVESISRPNVNTLFLPPSLPDGVFFVVTTRESDKARLQVDRQESIYISESDPRNIADVEYYVRGTFHQYQSEMLQAIQSWGVDEDSFVDIMSVKSEGNFMYLVYVLVDIRTGRLNRANLGKLRDLPSGLRSYYDQHWNIMRSTDPAIFESVQQQVICILASAREAVSVSQLMTWTGLPHHAVQGVILEWREFLNEEVIEGGEPFYRIYHASFRDFLQEAVGLRTYDDLIASSMDRKVKNYGGH
jgi:hypothetical protein